MSCDILMVVSNLLLFVFSVVMAEVWKVWCLRSEEESLLTKVRFNKGYHFIPSNIDALLPK